MFSAIHRPKLLYLRSPLVHLFLVFGCASLALFQGYCFTLVLFLGLFVYRCGAPFQFYCLPSIFCSSLRNLAFLYFIRGIVRVFSLPPCAGSFMLWYLPVFMLLCLCICYCFLFCFRGICRAFFFFFFRNLFRICRFSLQFSFVCAFSRY